MLWMLFQRQFYPGLKMFMMHIGDLATYIKKNMQIF